MHLIQHIQNCKDQFEVVLGKNYKTASTVRESQQPNFSSSEIMQKAPD
jgi:hypothetical protein